MKKLLITFLFAIQATSVLPAALAGTELNLVSPTYGQNAAVGATVTVQNTKIYYEVYGQGTPLLVLHPNGGSIEVMKDVIEEYKKDYQVIAIDNRAHGNSGAGQGDLTYEQMAQDVYAVAKKLKVKNAHLIGWSDGGILGLILAKNHPEVVSKMVLMGANTVPDGVYDFATQYIQKFDEMVVNVQKIDPNYKPEEGKLMRARFKLMLEHPHITDADLHKVTAQTLVMAGDRDIIKTTDTVHIFEQLPNANLLIVPAQTHFLPQKNPALFNEITRKFLSQPFEKPSSEEVLNK